MQHPQLDKENLVAHPSAPGKNGTLLVPAAAWHALHMRFDDLQAQNVKLAKEQQECARYLKAFLKIEHHRRERASTRLQATIRGMIARKHHPLPKRRRAAHLPLSREQIHVSRAVAPGPPRQRRVLSLEVRSCVMLQAAARGVLVRARLASLHRHMKAATRLQATIRGMRSRARHSRALERHRWSLRFSTLETALHQERRARKAQEAALRKLWSDVALLTQTLLPAGPAAAGESPRADAQPRKEAARVCRAAATSRRRSEAASVVQAAWRKGQQDQGQSGIAW